MFAYLGILLERRGVWGVRKEGEESWLVYLPVTVAFPHVEVYVLFNLSLQSQRACTSMRERITPSQVMQTEERLTSS